MDINPLPLTQQQNMGNLQGKVYSPGVMTQHSASTERPADFAGRAIKWWNSTLQSLSSLPERDLPYRVLVVSHGGWIQTLVQTLVNSRKLRVATGVVIRSCLNVSITTIEMGGGRKGVVVKFGDISHLITKAVTRNADELEGIIPQLHTTPS